MFVSCAVFEINVFSANPTEFLICFGYREHGSAPSSMELTTWSGKSLATIGDGKVRQSAATANVNAEEVQNQRGHAQSVSGEKMRLYDHHSPPQRPSAY